MVAEHAERTHHRSDGPGIATGSGESLVMTVRFRCASGQCCNGSRRQLPAGRRVRGRGAPRSAPSAPGSTRTGDITFRWLKPGGHVESPKPQPHGGPVNAAASPARPPRCWSPIPSASAVSLVRHNRSPNSDSANPACSPLGFVDTRLYSISPITAQPWRTACPRPRRHTRPGFRGLGAGLVGQLVGVRQPDRCPLGTRTRR